MQGIKNDDDKLKWAYFPWRAATEVMKVMHTGANKYHWNNWRNGFAASRLWSATLRHLIAWLWNKEDDETGISHLAHAATNLLFMLELDMDGKLKDDRSEVNSGSESSSNGHGIGVGSYSTAFGDGSDNPGQED